MLEQCNPFYCTPFWWQPQRKTLTVFFIFSQYPDGFGTGGTELFPSFIQGSSNFAFFHCFISMFASKATQAEPPGMHAVHDKQHAACSLLICTDIFGEESASHPVISRPGAKKLAVISTGCAIFVQDLK